MSVIKKHKDFNKSNTSITKFIFVCLCLLPIFINAQNLSNPFQTLKEKREFVYGIDNRRTHINQQSALIYGLYFGIGFGGKLRFKTGVSGMLSEKGKLIDEQGLVKKNRLLFLTLGEEFDFLIYNKLLFTTYFQTGIGYNYFRKLDQLKMEIIAGRNLIIPIEIGVQSSYDVLPWLGVKVGGGWRFVLPDFSYDLSGYYFKFGLNINGRKLIEQYRIKKVRTANTGQAQKAHSVSKNNFS